MVQLLTEPVANAIISAVSRGVPLETAIRAAGVSRESFYRLVERARNHQGISPETYVWAQHLVEQLDAARATWEAERVAAVHSIAADTLHRDSFRANTWLLNNHPSTRQTYREERRSIVEHQSGSDADVVEVHTAVRALSDEELLALAAGGDPEESEPNEPGLDR